MTPDDLDPTPELLAAVQAERQRVAGFIAQLQDRQARLSDELRAVTDQLDVARGRERQLGHVLGDEPAQDSNGSGLADVVEALAGRAADQHHGNGALRGAAIRQAAVEAALARDDRPERARHYREWLALIEASGRRVDGRDAAATLLTQLSRCPLIVRAPEAGTYQLDPAALTRLNDRRRALVGEADAHVETASEREYDALDLAQALARIQADIQRTDKDIAEAKSLIEQLDAGWFFAPADAVDGRAALAAS